MDTSQLRPASNPGVLDTATWDPPKAWAAIARGGPGGLLAGRTDDVIVHKGTRVRQGDTWLFLVTLEDGQRALVSIGRADEPVPGPPIGTLDGPDGQRLTAYAADAAGVDRFCRMYRPRNRPQVLGQTSRLGIGVRMTTAAWRGIFRAMDRGGFAANSIQNSVRELNLLEDILAGRPAPKNYACGFGSIETGYTGSTFEGLWLSGVLAALEHEGPLQYGADADHVQVKRADAGLEWAQKLLRAARYYTFYTLDLADVLDYAALQNDTLDESHLPRLVGTPDAARDLLAYHREPFAVGAATYRLDPKTIARCAAKYTRALDCAAELSAYIAALKQSREFDLELSIDEHPPEVPAWDCLTCDEELLFVLREARRRGLAISHVAPNFGIEKGVDYRHPSGLEGLQQRVARQHRLAQEFGTLLDIHSADDLGTPVRRVIQRATGGRVHYKVSPMLQILFAEVLAEHHPALFRRWWDDALGYATREAAAGSAFARTCLAAYEASDRVASVRQMVFHHYSFAFVGRRNERGEFLHRHEFYELSAAFYEAYAERLSGWLGQIATEVFC